MGGTLRAAPPGRAPTEVDCLPGIRPTRSTRIVDLQFGDTGAGSQRFESACRQHSLREIRSTQYRPEGRARMSLRRPQRSVLDTSVELEVKVPRLVGVSSGLTTNVP